MQTSLLPPNASRLERAVESAIVRAAEIDDPVDTLNRPATIAANLLPFMAWQFSVDRWNSDWSEARKRQAVGTAIVDHRRKGTPAALDTLLGDHDPRLRIVEWFEQSPRRAPHTFEVQLPLDATGGQRSTAAFATAVAADIAHVKPARSHYVLLQMLGGAGGAALVGAVGAAGLARIDQSAGYDASDIWDRFLQTEDGEPLTDDMPMPLEHQ